MATTVSMVVGTAIGGPLGGAIGAGIGSLLDQELFFKQESPQGASPSIDDIRISTASEGNGIPYILGRVNRVAGTVIWMDSELIEREVTQEVGGKGPDEEDVVVGYEYFVNFAVAWGTNADGDIQFIDKMWASGNKWYKRTNVLTYDGFPFQISRQFTGLFEFREAIVKSTDSDALLTTIKLGVHIELSDFTQAANNGTFQTLEKWVDDSGDSYMRIRRTSGDFVDETDPSAKVEQFKPNFRDGSVASLTFYTGGAETTDWVTFTPATRDAQPANSLIAATESKSIGFREIAYTVFEEFAITPYGNQVPQMSAQVDSTGALTAAEMISKIWERTGRSASEIDVSGLGTDLWGEVFGYVLVGAMSTREALRPIMIAGGIRVRETNGVLVFFDQGDETAVTITTGELGSAAFGQKAPKLIKIFDPSSIEMPAQAAVKYIDVQKALQRGNAIERGFIGASHSDNVLDLDFPISMGAGLARKIGRREIWNAVAERQRCQWTLPPRRLEVTVGDLLTLPVPITNDPAETDSENFEVVVTEINRGHDFLLEMRGFVEDSGGGEVTDNPDAEDAPPAQDDDVDGPSMAVLEVMDLPALGDSVVSQPGFYWALALGGRDEKFRGAVLFESTNDIDYSSIATTPLETVLGFANTALADTTKFDWPDEANTVDVVVFKGTLSGVSEGQMLGGANVALLGSELIAFRVATLLAEGVYRLSGILRGLRDTRDQSGTHVQHERFVLLDPTTIRFKTHNLSDRGTTRYYRGVPSGGAVADAQTETLVRNAQTMVPMAPTGIRASREEVGGTPNDIHVQWLARTRLISSFFNWADPPELESSERYEIDVYEDNTFAVLANTYTVTITAGSLPSWEYTEAAQTGDGLTPGDPLNIDIFKISDSVGRGTGRRATDI